jgi:predicted dehydrogenase
VAEKKPLRVAMIGYGFMGAAHSQAWSVAPKFFDLPLQPELAVVVGRDAERTAEVATRFGWESSATDWREVVLRDDIDLVDICSPGDTHAQVAVAALAAGKHVLCEKPLANSKQDAILMARAAEAALANGVFAMVGFTYRRVPAISFARELVRSGRIGALRRVQANYLQDWLVDENAPMTWRLDKTRAGSGSLGDIGAHAIDAVQFVTGQTVASVSGTLQTFVAERPLLGEGIGLSGTASDERGMVTVDDSALFTGKLSGGALASFEATRFATGRKNAFRLEFSGSTGAVSFDLERMNELEFYDGTDAAGERGFRRILVTEPEHPYAAAWWPTGHGLGYEHAFSHQVRDLVVDIAARRQPEPSFDGGLQVQTVLEAIEHSAAHGSEWTTV